MICSKCNHKLPEDSEFCQYCGTRVEKAIVSPAAEQNAESIVVEPIASDVATPFVSESKIPDPQLPDFDKMTQDEVLNSIIQIQAENTIEAMGANSKNQPNNEDDSDFGLVPQKPVFTLALKSVAGEREYLNNLYTVHGERIKYNRRGSIEIDGVNGIIDVYETYLPSGQPYKTIYINMYGAKRSTKAPAGFTLGKPTVRPSAVPASQQECGLAVDVAVQKNMVGHNDSTITFTVSKKKLKMCIALIAAVILIIGIIAGMVILRNKSYQNGYLTGYEAGKQASFSAVSEALNAAITNTDADDTYRFASEYMKENKTLKVSEAKDFAGVYIEFYKSIKSIISQISDK